MRRISRSLLFVIGGEMLLRLASGGVAVLIGRVFGVATLGIYAAILAVATLAERFADNGLETYGIADASAHPEMLGRLATSLYINKTVFSALAIGVLATLGWATGLTRAHWLIAVILTLRTFLYSYCRLNTGLLKALNKTPQIARIQVAHFLFLCCLIMSAFLQVKRLAFLLLCLLAAQLFEFVLSLWILRSLGARFVSVPPSQCWNLARRSTPIGLTYTLSTLMLRGDVLVLSMLASVSVVGAFAAADSGLVLVYVIAWLFSGVLLANLGALAKNTPEFDLHFRKCVSAILTLCIPVTAAALLFAPSAIRLLFGSKFASAGLPAAIMTLAIPFIFLNAAFLSRAIARNSAAACLAVYAIGTVSSLFLNFLLGWRYQATGIAISIVLREIAITLAFLRLSNLPSAMGQPAEHLTTDSKMIEVLNA